MATLGLIDMMAHPEPTAPPGSPDETNAHARSPLLAPLDAAQMLTARGWVVGPADHPDAATHCTCSRGPSCKASTDPTKRGKHPRVRWSELQRPASAEQLRAWFAPHDQGGGPYGELTNTLVACGPSGLLVVDGDEAGALGSYAASIGEVVPATFRVITGRGEHHYFALPTDDQGVPLLVGNSPGVLADWHCDVRGGASASGEFGGYVIGPGSTHYTGVRYVAPDPYAAVAPAPGWLIVALTLPRAARRGMARRGSTSAARDAGGGGVDTRAGTARDPGRIDGTRWTDDIRYGSPAQLVAQFRGHLDEVTALALTPAEIARGEYPNGGEFRHALFRAARDAFRLCDPALSGVGALYDEPTALGLVADAVRAVWAGVRDPRSGDPLSGEPNDDDQRIVWEESAPAAEASPWRLTGAGVAPRDASATSRADRDPRHERSSRFLRPSEVVTSGNADTQRTTDGNSSVPPTTEGEPRGSADDDPDGDEFEIIERPAMPTEAQIAAEQLAQRRRKAYEQLDARKWAEDEWTAEHADPLEFLSLDELLDDAPPEYLVPDMIYRDGLAVLFGGPGSGKSFVALDIALSIVSGLPWRPGFEDAVLTGRDGGRGVVHYVMAEGRRSNRKRMPAWLHARKVDDVMRAEMSGRFVAIPNVIPLSPAGVRGYLERARADRPDLVILDTRNPMFVGSESSGDDYGAMIRVLHMIREASGGAVLLLDHSGLTAEHRTRGSNAQQAGIDTEIMMEYRDGYRVVTMTRDKDEGVLGDEAARWYFTLSPIEGVPGYPMGRKPPVVLVPADEPGKLAPLHPLDPWWLDELPVRKIAEPIDAVRDAKGRPHGGRPPALDIMRLLRRVPINRGFTEVQLRSMLNEAPHPGKKDRHSRSKVYAGLDVLQTLGMVETGTPDTLYVLVRRYSMAELPDE